MMTPFETVLEALARERGVTGALIASEEDGIVIDSTLRVGVEGEPIAAVVAALYRRARLGVCAAGLGAVRLVHLAGERGHLYAAGRGDLIIVTVLEPGAQEARIRALMLRSVEGLA